MTRGRFHVMRLAAMVLGCALLAGCRAVKSGSTTLEEAPLPVAARAVACERLPATDAQARMLAATPTSSSRNAGRDEVVLASATELESRRSSASATDHEASYATAIEKQRGQPSGVTSASVQLTLADLQQLALANNPTLRQVASQVAQARGNWEQVGLYPNPQLVAVQAANNGPFDSFNLFVTQPVVRGDKLELNRNVAAFDIQRAGWEAEAQRLRVLNDVQIRYVMLLAARQRLEIAREMLSLAQRGQEVSERLQKEEEVAEIDVLQARLQYEQAQLFVRDVQFQAAEAAKRLADVVGTPDLQDIPLDGTLDVEMPTLEFEESYRQVLARSPVLAAARSRLLATRAQTQRELAQPVPNVALTGGVGHDFFRPQYMMYSLFMGIDVPIFNRNQGNIAAAAADARNAQREIERLELALRNDLTVVFQRYETARNEVRMYGDVMLPTARRNLAIVERNYEEGEGDVLRVLTARRNLYQVEVGRNAAVASLRSAVIEIEGLLLRGGLLPLRPEPIKSNNAGRTATPGYYWK